MKILKKIIGYLLVASPFIFMGFICFRIDMFEEFIVAILASVVTIFAIFTGVDLIKK